MNWICAFWSGHVGADAGCRCRVLLQGAAVKVLCVLWLWSWLAGAAAGRWCRVLLSKGCLHLRNLGAATRYCCQNAVCAMKLRCWCGCRGWLRDVYGSVGVGPWWRLRLCCSKKCERLVATKTHFLLSGAGLCWLNSCWISCGDTICPDS